MHNDSAQARHKWWLQLFFYYENVTAQCALCNRQPKQMWSVPQGLRYSGAHEDIITAPQPQQQKFNFWENFWMLQNIFGCSPGGITAHWGGFRWVTDFQIWSNTCHTGFGLSNIHAYRSLKHWVKVEGEPVPLSNSQVGGLVFCEWEFHSRKQGGLHNHVPFRNYTNLTWRWDLHTPPAGGWICDDPPDTETERKKHQPWLFAPAETTSDEQSDKDAQSAAFISRVGA